MIPHCEDVAATRAALVSLTTAALALPRYKVTNEEELQAAIAGELLARRVSFDREWILSRRDRIDFLIGRGAGAGIGVEVKVAGTATECLAQLLRYSTAPEIQYLILATTRRSIGRMIPDRLNGIPVDVVYLRAAL